MPSNSSAFSQRNSDKAIGGAPVSETEFRDLADAAPVLLWTAAPDGSCLYVNKGWLDFVGRELSAELGSGWLENLHPDDRDATAAAVSQAVAARRRFEVEYRLRRHDGQYRLISGAGVPRFDDQGEFVGFVGSCTDITEQKQAQLELQYLLAESEQAGEQLVEQARRLHQLADSDPLTGVLNRRSFLERFEREWSRAERHEHALSCIMLDIDFFKKVNDTHGHVVGDAILKRVAEVLKEQCRPSDLVCRWGGEEFCVMAPETTEEGAAVLAERLRLLLVSTKVDLFDKTVFVTSSFGVAERTGETANADDLVDHADQALHIAKHAGRNRVIRFAAEGSLANVLAQDSPANILQHLTAKDLMTATPCLHQNETVGRAIELLLRHGVGSAPVIDERGKLVGFISERDLMLLNVSREAWASPVREVMKTNVVSYEQSALGQEIFQFLCRVSLHRIVVVNDGRPVGVISPSSLLKHFKARMAADQQRCEIGN